MRRASCVSDRSSSWQQLDSEWNLQSPVKWNADSSAEAERAVLNHPRVCHTSSHSISAAILFLFFSISPFYLSSATSFFLQPDPTHHHPSMSSASTALSISSRTHAASLLPIDAHSPALLALVAVQVDTEILRQSFCLSYSSSLSLTHPFHAERMALFVIRLVQPYNYGLLTPPSTPPSPAAFPLANLVAFIDNIMVRSRGTFATLLVARIYLQRLRSQLPYYCPAGNPPPTPTLGSSHLLIHFPI